MKYKNKKEYEKKVEDLKLFGTYFFHENKKSVILTWNFFSDNNFPEDFIIEKSLDNEEFETIGKVKKLLPYHRTFSYLFTDEHLYSGYAYYRIYLKKRGATKKIISISNTLTIKIPVDKNYIDNNEEKFEDEPSLVFQ